MISVGIKEFKTRLSHYVDKIRRGQEIVITDRGTEVALVIPISKERQSIQSLVASGKAHWTGGKPRGKKGLKIKGRPLSETVLEQRR